MGLVLVLLPGSKHDVFLQVETANDQSIDKQTTCLTILPSILKGMSSIVIRDLVSYLPSMVCSANFAVLIADDVPKRYVSVDGDGDGDDTAC